MKICRNIQILVESDQNIGHFTLHIHCLPLLSYTNAVNLVASTPSCLTELSPVQSYSHVTLSLLQAQNFVYITKPSLKQFYVNPSVIRNNNNNSNRTLLLRFTSKSLRSRCSGGRRFKATNSYFTERLFVEQIK